MAESEDQEHQSRPSVSQDQWIKHARKKLAKGYVLIVSETKRNANFHKPGKGYEMCAYRTAKLLISEGLVTEMGKKHHLGKMYELASHIAPEPPAKASEPGDGDPPAEEWEQLLEDLDTTVDDEELAEEAED